MDKYTIKEKTITEKIYTTDDGFEFKYEQDAYDHVAFMFTEDVLDNKTNSVDIDSSLFADEYITSWELSNKSELNMFLHSFLDKYDMYNEEEIKNKAQDRISFPCTLCATEYRVFFKEDLISELEGVLNEIKRGL